MHITRSKFRIWGLWPALVLALGSGVNTLVAATPISACGTITTDSIVVVNIVAATQPCIIIAADNIKLDLDGFTIDMRDVEPGGPAISALGQTNIQIKGPGMVLTEFDSLAEDSKEAIIAQDGGLVVVRSVTVRNVDTNGDCLPISSRSGTGIRLFGQSGPGVNGASVESNFVECFPRGIQVINSNPGAGVTARIARNTVKDATSGDFFAFGISLESSDGWMVNHNTVTGSGSVFLPVQAGIQMVSGADNNSIIGNVSDDNVSHGIRAAGGSTGNVILRNHATGNGLGGLGFTDLNDTSGGVNTWNDNNICSSESGAVPTTVCNVGEM